jgi:hypothetical protein
VAELEPGKWDTQLIDPMTEGFLAATAGHDPILSFSTIPVWLFRTPKPVAYPADPNEVTWTYSQGTELIEGGLARMADYFARLVAWYTRSGFADGRGKRHTSPYHYRIPYWEVFCEPDDEHKMSAEDYTARYDAVVRAIHAVSPETKFVGLSLEAPSRHPEMFEYFLNYRNHELGIPLDMISYHFYAEPAAGETPEEWQYTMFDQADGFFNTVRYVEQIRKRLSPQTETDLDEIGTILPNGKIGKDPIPAIYWNASSVLYVYCYLEAMRQGIEVVGESLLVGYPTNYPSVSLLDWNTGRPNARYWVLKLIQERLAPGDRLVETNGATPEIAAQALSGARGRTVLLANKRNRKVTVRLKQEWTGAEAAVLDSSAPPRTLELHGQAIELAPFAVTFLSGK